MIRLAQQLGAAPDKLRGSEGERISNQRPIAEKAARDFSEDIRRFVRSYARRHSSPCLCGTAGVLHGRWDDDDSHKCDRDFVRMGGDGRNPKEPRTEARTTCSWIAPMGLTVA